MNPSNTEEAVPGIGRLARVFASLFPSWVSFTASQALIGWLVFAATSSAALVGVAFALRYIPLAVTGVPMGALSDRFGRLRLLVASNAIQAVISFALAAAALTKTPPVTVLFLASAGYGVADSARLVSGVNLTYDLSGRLGAMRAMATANVVSGIGMALGGVIAGVILARAGASVTATVVGVAFSAGAVTLVGLPALPGPTARGRSSLLSLVRAGLGLVHSVPVIGLLIAIALVVEVFAFSGMALDPVFAGAVFAVGPLGLGAILTARAVGRISGAGVVALVGPRTEIGRWLAAAVALFGAGLVGFALSPAFDAALALVWVAGVAGVIVDVLEQTALQAGVSAASRGRATGLWVLTVGVGPLGVLEVGVVAQLLGARLAQASNGLLVAIFGLLLLGKLGRRVRSIATASPPPTLE